MTDISKCWGENCKLRDTCFRYLAEPSDWQSYLTIAPSSDTECVMYWKCEPDSLTLLNKMWKD